MKFLRSIQTSIIPLLIYLGIVSEVLAQLAEKVIDLGDKIAGLSMDRTVLRIRECSKSTIELSPGVIPENSIQTLTRSGDSKFLIPDYSIHLPKIFGSSPFGNPLHAAVSVHVEMSNVQVLTNRIRLEFITQTKCLLTLDLDYDFKPVRALKDGEEVLILDYGYGQGAKTPKGKRWSRNSPSQEWIKSRSGPIIVYKQYLSFFRGQESFRAVFIYVPQSGHFWIGPEPEKIIFMDGKIIGCGMIRTGAMAIGMSENRIAPGESLPESVEQHLNAFADRVTQEKHDDQKIIDLIPILGAPEASASLRIEHLSYLGGNVAVKFRSDGKREIILFLDSKMNPFKAIVDGSLEWNHSAKE